MLNNYLVYINNWKRVKAKQRKKLCILSQLMVEVGYRVMEIMELKGSQGFELGSNGGTRKY